MTPWKPSDGLCGVIYLPDQQTKAAYGDACRKAIISNAAEHVISMGSLLERRAFVDKYPAAMREYLKKEILERWQSGNSQKDEDQ
jgi:hypothetical protein